MSVNNGVIGPRKNTSSNYDDDAFVSYDIGTASTFAVGDQMGTSAIQLPDIFPRNGGKGWFSSLVMLDRLQLFGDIDILLYAGQPTITSTEYNFLQLLEPAAKQQVGSISIRLGHWSTYFFLGRAFVPTNGIPPSPGLQKLQAASDEKSLWAIFQAQSIMTFTTVSALSMKLAVDHE